MTYGRGEGMTYGELIRDCRIASGKSLRAVARYVGISHVYLGFVERGARARLNPGHLEKLLEVLPTLTRAEVEALSSPPCEDWKARAEAAERQVDALIATLKHVDDELFASIEQHVLGGITLHGIVCTRQDVRRALAAAEVKPQK